MVDVIHHRVTIFTRATTGEHKGEIEDLEGIYDRNHGGEEDGRREQRQGHAPEQLKAIGPIDTSRLEVRGGYTLQAGEKDDHVEAQPLPDADQRNRWNNPAGGR